MLELVEEALDTIALLVEIDVVDPLNVAVTLRRDNDLGTGLSNPVCKVVGIVTLVGDGGFDLNAVDQVMGEGDVVVLAGRGDQANGKP